MAQRRRKRIQQQRRQRMITALCIAGGIGAVAISAFICMIVFGAGMPGSAPVSAPAATALPYEVGDVFSIADLTPEQLSQLREQGRVSVSDGPRGVSVGDTLDTLLERFPSAYAGEQPDEEQILYCADYFENIYGVMTVLPPRALLSADSSFIYVTMLAPTSPYPEGTRENYGDFEHVYCQFTIEPDEMTVRSIVLGIEQ